MSFKSIGLTVDVGVLATKVMSKISQKVRSPGRDATASLEHEID